MIVDDFHLATYKLLLLSLIRYRILTQIMRSVNQKRTLRRIMDAIEGTALGGRNLCANPILESRSVISKRKLLFNSLLRKVISLSTLLFPLSTNKRHNQDIAIFLSATRSTDMRLRKTCHHFRHRSPTGIRLHRTVWTRLTHTEWHRRTRERTSYPLAAYTRVNILPNLSRDRCRKQ